MRRRVASVLASLSLLLSMAGSTSPATAGDEAADPECRTPHGEFSSSVPAYCESWYDDAWELGDTDAIVQKVWQSVGERFAGSWIDRSVSPSALRIGVKGATPEDQATLEEASGLPPSRATVVNGKYNNAELAHYRAIVLTILNTKTYAYMMGVQHNINRVEVFIGQADPLLRGQLAVAGLPSDAYSLSTGTITTSW